VYYSITPVLLQGGGPEKKQTGCVLIIRQGEEMAKQRYKTLKIVT
jgi:hypothetical protein